MSDPAADEHEPREIDAVNQTRTKVGLLTLRVSKLRTFHNSSTEVALYENHYAGRLEVGKRLDSLDRPFVERLLEPQTQASFNHPNLVPIFAATEALNLPSDVPPEARPIMDVFTPYYERGSILDALDDGCAFPLSETLAVARAASRGLAELHDNGFVHRDVKSTNIFLADDNTIAKVGDLGEVAKVDREGRVAGLRAPLPSTAPEQIHQGHATARSDLFGLGITLLEMLNGLFPYDEMEPLDWKRRLERGWTALPPRQMGHRPTTPPRLRSLINRMIGADPERRPESAHAVLDQLRRVRVLNWELVVDEAEERRWEGTVPRSDYRYAVAAEWRPRLKQWDVVGMRRISAWRRCTDNLRVNSLNEAYPIFDEVLGVAVSDAK